MNGPRPKIVLDCDPGHDDAAAIVVAAAYTELLAITTVSGNAPLAQTTHNALLMTQLFDLHVPVAAGAACALNGSVAHAPSIHGISGLDGPEHPPLSRSVVDKSAVELLSETVRAHSDVWVVATGPLTNVAAALQREPEIAQRIAGISFMGGSASFGNWTVAAEFNTWADPEAAEIVLASGVPLRMVGLNATHQVLVGEQHVDELLAMNESRATFMAELYRFFRATYFDAFGMPEAPLHDPCAVLAVSHPELLDLHPRHVAVECNGTLTRGMTVVDQRGFGMGAEPNVLVSYNPDGPAILELVRAAVLH